MQVLSGNDFVATVEYGNVPNMAHEILGFLSPVSNLSGIVVETGIREITVVKEIVDMTVHRGRVERKSNREGYCK